MVETHPTTVLERPGKGSGRKKVGRPTAVQKAWLRRGLIQPGGKLPLFDGQGQFYKPRTIQSCIEQGWAEPWVSNPIKSSWLVCKLTETGRRVLQRQGCSTLNT